MHKKYFLFYLIFLNTIVHGQDKNIVDSFFDRINYLEFSEADKVLREANLDTEHPLNYLFALITNKEKTDIQKINSNQNSHHSYYADKVVSELIKAYEELYFKKEKSLALSHFDRAFQLSRRESSNALQYFCIKEILKLYLSRAIQSNDEYAKYLNDLKKVIENNSQLLSYYGFKFRLLAQTETYNTKVSKNEDTFKSIFISYDSVANIVDPSNKILYRYYLDKGNRIKNDKPKQAEHYYQVSLDLLGNEVYYNSIKKVLFLQLSKAYQNQGLFNEALETLDKAEHVMDKASHLNNFALNTYKSEVFTEMNLLDSAIFYQEKAKYNQINWDLQRQNVEISLMQVKLRTAEKEKSLLQTRVWLIGTSIVLVFLTILSYLLIRYSRRKRLIALQEKEIETQKNLTLLKEQEISTINAMVEGQEKERKRVAEDLHDNLGSVIATLKLHFENLRMNRKRKKIDQEQLFDKTENLIDEAYQKVRSIAHAKNAGVIANQGLLFAVKLMAEKISAANTIQIDVIDYGLEKPLENSLEISLFRIIQELTTNIIKHAKANHATINISQDEEDITILIEDNGIGMDTSQIDLQKGMGLHSIKTRVEHLDGTFTIDSTPTKGTTIIIQIPS